MRKVVSILIVLIIAASLCACGNNKEVVLGYVDGQTWFFSGGTDTVVNSITFYGEKAYINQIIYDGEGKDRSRIADEAYDVDSSNIIFPLSDGNELIIPYTIDGDNIKLGKGDYFTISEVEAALQGVWQCRSSSVLDTGIEYNIYLENGSIVSEHAAEAFGYSNGEYYYYGPYYGTYKIDKTGFSSDIREERLAYEEPFGFGIINGEVVFLRYTDVFTPGYGLKGENGYSF